MKKVIWLVALFLVLTLALAGCGRTQTSAERGKELFAQTTLEDQPGCITCHSLSPGTIIIGPSAVGFATRADSMVPGQSAEEYLRLSIVDPNQYLVPDFPRDTMPPVWGDRLSSQQVDDLVAYMLTLK